MSLRLAFMGTPAFAVPTLAELIGAAHDIACVYTQPPRPKGRGLSEEKSPVHKFAEAAGIAVRTPVSLKGADEQAAFAALELDVAVVVAYGLLLPRPILEAPKLGCINLHGSLLPRWRGAAPIQRSIMACDSETGVMAMKMEEGLDTGPVLMAEHIAIGRKTYGELHDALARLGADLMGRTLGALERGAVEPMPQPARGRHLREKNRQIRNAHRLDTAGGCARLHDPRTVTCAGRLVRSQGRTHQIAVRRSCRGKRRTGRSAVRYVNRLRRRRPQAHNRTARGPGLRGIGARSCGGFR
jgi:methionyl-tRNA formyltransferase